MDKKIICIIPARGGSKRLPRKNILPILGRPMLSYPIEAALKSRLFDSVVVSTEDEEIAHEATSAGAKVFDRPAELAEDRATVVQVCQEVIETLISGGQELDYFCCIYATAIFITPDDLNDSLNLLNSEPYSDFVMGVSEYNLHPVQALVEKKGFLEMMWPEYHAIQSQYHPHLVASNGTFYWAHISAFMKNKSFYGKKLKGYIIPKIRAVDIDTIEDFRFAEILAAQLFLQNSSNK